MLRLQIAALTAAVVSLVAVGSAGGANGNGSTARDEDETAQFDARNLTSEVEACWAEWEDYRRCRSAAVLNRGMGQLAVPLGRHPGQARVVRATVSTYTLDARSRSGNHFLVMKTRSPRLARRCAKRGRGLCPSSGRW
jgi:hypothetical protein